MKSPNKLDAANPVIALRLTIEDQWHRVADLERFGDNMRMRWILIALLAIYVAGCKPGYVRRTEEFATRVRSVVKPEELQAWATNLIAKTHFEGRDSLEIKPSDVPQSVHAIYGEYPEMVLLQHSETGDFVEIWYGGGFKHWGIDVGSPSFRGIKNPRFYVVPWKPGIYFWIGP